MITKQWRNIKKKQVGNGNTFINILILLIKQINTLILYVQGEELGYVQDHFKMNLS